MALSQRQLNFLLCFCILFSQPLFSIKRSRVTGLEVKVTNVSSLGGGILFDGLPSTSEQFLLVFFRYFVSCYFDVAR